MTEGSVATVSAQPALSSAAGVAVAGGFAFVADGGRVVQVGVDGGTSSSVAGSAMETGCTDASTGALARFGSDARVVGSDGQMVLVLDGCGVRGVDRLTGATSTLTTRIFVSAAVVGQSLVGTDGHGLVFVVDLGTGVSRQVTSSAPGTRLAADAQAAWLVEGRILRRVDLTYGGVDVVTLSLPTWSAPGAVVSVGSYLYLDVPGRLVRVSKSSGAWQHIAGAGVTGHVDGVSTAARFGAMTGIGSDGTRLYVAENGSGGGRVRTVSAVESSPATVPATAPVMAAGTVSTVATSESLSSANGVAVVNGSAFVVDGYRLARIDRASGAVSLVAGDASAGCSGDVAAGSQARFSNDWMGNRPTVLGTDGAFVYVVDGCGLRRVDPVTGATYTLQGVSRLATILGQHVFDNNSQGMIRRRDLGTGAQTVVTTSAPAGPLAADGQYLWTVYNTGLYRIDPASGAVTMVSNTLPAVFDSTALLSVGDYLYLNPRSRTSPQGYASLARISKDTGAWQQIAGGGVSGGGQWISSITGIASDGAALYVADTATPGGSGGWLKTVTPSDPQTFPAPPSAPVMEAGAVGTLTAPGALSTTNGVAIVGGAAFTADGPRIARIDRGSGVTTIVAGSSDHACVDAGTGAAARFSNDYSGIRPRVIGADGTFVYVIDSCGVRQVDPATGATFTISTNRYHTGTVAGHHLYGADGYGKVTRHDLRTGVTSTLTASVPTGPVAADAAAVWLVDGPKLYRIDATTGHAVTVSTTLPFTNTSPIYSAMTSVGDYLYLGQFRQGTTVTWPSLVRISKLDGAWQDIAGSVSGHVDGVYIDAAFGSITGIASDGAKLYVTDSAPGAGAWVRVVRKTKLPLASGGPALWRETAGGSNPSELDPCVAACHGDPVHTDTGALMEQHTDLDTTGVGVPLVMARSYSSHAASTATPLGHGWSFPFGMTLRQATDASGQVFITQENGSVITFVGLSDGSYRAAPRVRATLTRGGDGTWTMVRKRHLSIVFDPSGKLIRESDRDGNTTTLTYDGANRLTRVTDQAGRALTFTYNGANRISTVTAPSGRTVTYTHNPDGDLTAVTTPGGDITRFQYDSRHLLTTITGPRGGTITNTYDTTQRVVRQTDPAGRTTTFAYTDGDEVGSSTVTVTGPDGTRTIDQYIDGQLRSQTRAAGTTDAATTTFGYDPTTSQRVTVTDAAGAVTTSTVDTDGNQLTVTDPLGRTTTFTYYADGNQTSTTDPAGRASTATYDAHGHRLTATTPSGRVQRYTYNTNGTLASATTPGGRTTTYTYDTAGNPATTTDPVGRTTGYGHDPDGRTTTVTDPTGKVTTTTFTPAGQVATVTEPAGHTTAYSYDADGNRTGVTDANGRTTTSTYDLVGALLTSTDPTGRVTTNTYDQAGNLTTVTDPAQHTTGHTYDRLGHRLTTTDPIGRITRYTYDPVGRLLTTTNPAGAVARTTYDAAGQTTTTIDAKQQPTTYTYDPAGRVTATTDPRGQVHRRTYTIDGQPATETDAAPNTSTEVSAGAYQYDLDGNLTTYTNPDGHHTTYTYNPAGQRTSRTLPGGLVTGYTYDTAGRPAVTTNPDGTTLTHTYDTAGRLTRTDDSTPGAAPVTYTYDNAGQRTSMTDSTGTTHYTYDTTGRTTSTTNGAGATVTYTYDTAGRLHTLTYPGGHSVTYTYDAAGQMTSATDWAANTTTFTWTPDGRQAQQTTPNGVTTTTDRDATGLTTAIEISRGTTTLSSFGYTYNTAGQLTGQSTSTGADYTYTYDTSQQLANATPAGAPPTSGGYTSTPAGQLTTLPDGTTQSYNTAEQLTHTTPPQGPATTYQYSDNGERLTAHTGATSSTPAQDTTYHYTNTGALASVTSTNHDTVTYTSDGAGIRQTRTHNGVTRHLTWATEGGGTPFLLDDGTHRYLYGPTMTPYAQINTTTGTTEYLHTDALGSVRTITNTTGQPIATNTYDAYGNRTTHTGTTTSAIGYTGAWTDPTTTLIYLRARDYDPTTGQFLTIDPAIDTTHHPYAYAANNPLQNTDPTGLCADCNWLDKLVLSGPSNAVGDFLEHNTAGRGLTSLMVGFGDGASFGLTAKIREDISPGSNCLVDKNFWYYGAGLAGGAASTYLGGELVAGVVRVGGALRMTNSGTVALRHIPKESLVVMGQIEREGVIVQSGLRGPAAPKMFANDARGGGSLLPEVDQAGAQIVYREWGTVPRSGNPIPGGERIVTGSDGSMYYSPDHYKTYLRFR